MVERKKEEKKAARARFSNIWILFH